MEIFEVSEAPEVTISSDDYAAMVAENEFLYQHFNGEVNPQQTEEINHLRRELDNLRREHGEVVHQRDDLQYHLDETRKSKTYKLSRAITYVPRKLRGDMS